MYMSMDSILLSKSKQPSRQDVTHWRRSRVAIHLVACFSFRGRFVYSMGQLEYLVFDLMLYSRRGLVGVMFSASLFVEAESLERRLLVKAPRTNA